jgi:hypothetical protein
MIDFDAETFEQRRARILRQADELEWRFLRDQAEFRAFTAERPRQGRNFDEDTVVEWRPL